jgi:hypothetical protein
MRESTTVEGRPNSSRKTLSPAIAMFTALRRFESIISPRTSPSTSGAAGYPLLLIRKPTRPKQNISPTSNMLEFTA